MSWSSTPSMGTVDLSGTTSIVLRINHHVVDHAIPGREGDITERVGSAAKTIEIHGFLFSGADAQIATLLSYIGTIQPLVIPSTRSGYYFLPATGLILKNRKFIYDAGKSSPHYSYVFIGYLYGTIGVFDKNAFDNKPTYAFDTN